MSILEMIEYREQQMRDRIAYLEEENKTLREENGQLICDFVRRAGKSSFNMLQATIAGHMMADPSNAANETMRKIVEGGGA